MHTNLPTPEPAPCGDAVCILESCDSVHHQDRHGVDYRTFGQRHAPGVACEKCGIDGDDQPRVSLVDLADELGIKQTVEPFQPLPPTDVLKAFDATIPAGANSVTQVHADTIREAWIGGDEPVTPVLERPDDTPPLPWADHVTPWHQSTPGDPWERFHRWRDTWAHDSSVGVEVYETVDADGHRFWPPVVELMEGMLDRSAESATPADVARWADAMRQAAQLLDTLGGDQS